MARGLPRISVVGVRKPSARVFDRLEATGRYQFDYAGFSETHSTLFQDVPDLILLRMPDEKKAAEEALGWLEKLKKETTVVVASPSNDLDCYLEVMWRGAFDYFTDYTSLQEITRILDNALAWRTSSKAA